jgi:glycine/D-amino acid oxidase-like deaminating enzyme
MLQFQDTPYWHIDITKPTFDVPAIPRLVDVVIIGSGLTGLVIALHLLRGGRSVAIFDAMNIGDGASGKNGGMVGPSLHKLGLEGLTNKYGNKKAMAILQEGMNAIDYFKSFIIRETIECDLEMTGRFRGATTQKAVEKIIRDSEKLTDLKGFRFDVINKHDIPSEIGSNLYQGGVVYHQDGGLHPFKLLCELVKKVVSNGGLIFEKTLVGGTYQTPNGIKVETDKGALIARDVVVASNGYTKKFAPGIRQYISKRLLPITSAMIASEQLSSDTIDGMFPNKRMHGGNHRLVQYYRASPDHTRVLFGARGIDTYDRALQNGKVLKKHLCKIFPELQNVRIEYSWSGKVAYTFDHSPHLGKWDGVYYAMGYCGSGVTRSVYLAYKLANRILGLDDYRTAFDDLPFESRPFYTGTPWFMPMVLKWHSFLDHIEGN